MRKILLALLVLNSGFCLAMNPMDQANMERLVKSKASQAKGEKGVVEFEYNSVTMYLISDVNHDRMRIVAPVIEYEKLTKDQIDSVMNSNYHRALDARYAVSDGILFSVYIHPLSQLSDTQIDSAIEQVANLALSFGSQYTSGMLNFGDQ